MVIESFFLSIYISFFSHLKNLSSRFLLYLIYIFIVAEREEWVRFSYNN
jgi:hypothetical protein